MKFFKKRYIYTVRVATHEHSFTVIAWNRDKGFRRAKKLAMKYLLHWGAAVLDFIGEEKH